MERGDLVDAAARLALLDQRLGLGHGGGLALAGAVEHVADMAQEHAKTLVKVAGALAHHAAHAAALAGRDADVSLVILKELADALVVDLLRPGGDGALERDNAHDAGTHRGGRRMLDLAGGGVLMEGVCDLGMRDAELLVDQQELENAGRVGRQQIDLEPHLRHDDLDDKTDVGDLVQDLAGALDRTASCSSAPS